jgi:quinone-modifying oxidoreductase, subunit QmoC
MSTVVDTGLLADIKRFGDLDVSACFSCGNCTAVCPLSDNDGTFPRRIIRYAQVGMKDSLLSSKELWTCYHCGLCSETCPTEADPGAFMAAARRYAIASYDRTRLARTLYTRPVAGSAIAIVLAALFAVFMYAQHGPKSSTSLELFTFVPEGLVHWTGVAVMILMTVAGVAGVVTLARGIARKEGAHLESVSHALAALWVALGIESLGQRRYRADCRDDRQPEALWRRRWLVHALTVWGFLGLLTATVLDYTLALAGVKKTGAHVALWYPPRLIGTIAGAALVYGVSVLILNRLQRSNQTAKTSTPSDWLFPVLLWVTGVTGFLLELALYLPHAPVWGYWVFLLHVSVAMELMLLLPFIKFAHAVYRPVALFFYALASGKAA